MPLDDSTAITVAGVRVWEEPGPQGYIREVLARQFEQNRAERILLCNWTDRITLAIGLLGGSINVGGVSQGIPPAIYPAVSNWICLRIEISGDGLQSAGINPAMIAFERARCRVIYGPPQWDPSTTNTGEIELDFSSSAFALDQQQQSFKFGDGSPVSPSLMPVVRLTTIMVSITKYDLAVLPTQTITSLIDCTNSGTFLGGSAEHILFRGARSSKKFTAQGNLNWDLTMAFEARAQGGWNQLWKPGSGWTDFTDMGGTKLFPPQNLQVLIA